MLVPVLSGALSILKLKSNFELFIALGKNIKLSTSLIYLLIDCVGQIFIGDRFRT
jgi:hypothetical protein